MRAMENERKRSKTDRRQSPLPAFALAFGGGRVAAAPAAGDLSQAWGEGAETRAPWAQAA
eukprot:97984-Pyramimonas_sp.AAC.1